MEVSQMEFVKALYQFGIERHRSHEAQIEEAAEAKEDSISPLGPGHSAKSLPRAICDVLLINADRGI